MTSPRVNVKPETLRWACERSRLDPAFLAKRFPQLPAWESGEKQPTLKQLEAFCRTTHAAVGYFFGGSPPDEAVPIPDFRTIANTPVSKPSGDLLDAVYLCQNRQYWYEEYARMEGEPPLPFVGSAALTDPVERVAADIRHTLGFDLEERRRLGTWTEALRRFIVQADDAGILVMVSGVVGSNTRRKLDPAEFRGFALADPLAPVVFVNGADTKAAQMFTLAHELAHIWLGESALSDSEARQAPRHGVERWCSEVAAELLVPMTVLREEGQPVAELRSELDRLARRFKVSTLVVLRRMHDAGWLPCSEYRTAYDSELKRLDGRSGAGGRLDFYFTAGARTSRRFARAIIVEVLQGKSAYTEASYLLSIKRKESFRRLGCTLGVDMSSLPA